MSTDRRIEAAIRAYQQRPLQKAAAEMSGFANEASLEAAVSRAALAQGFNKKGKLVRHGHQRRIPQQVLELVRERLLAADLGGYRSFHDLFVTIKGLIGGVHGVGELMLYDTAVRIGAKLRLVPEKVYLHSGTRVGARRLGLDWKAKWIEKDALPAQLQGLPPWQVEDILCIYKDWFAEGGRPTNA